MLKQMIMLQMQMGCAKNHKRFIWES